MRGRDAFEAHGTLSLSVQPPLLVIEAEGPWNMEFAQRYLQQIHGYRNQLQSAPWASLVTLHGTAILPQDACDLLVQTIQQAQRINLVATAVIFDNVDYCATTKQLWASVYERSGLPYEFCDSRRAAEVWLLEQIARATAKDPQNDQ